MNEAKRTAPRILVVEDDPDNRRIVVKVLAVDGYATLEAADGESAVKAVRELRPDVVLLDVQLPDFDGFEVARRLARMNGGSPAVILTSSRDAADFGPLVEQSGAVGFVPKAELSGPALVALLP